MQLQNFVLFYIFLPVIIWGVVLFWRTLKLEKICDSLFKDVSALKNLYLAFKRFFFPAYYSLLSGYQKFFEGEGGNSFLSIITAGKII